MFVCKSYIISKCLKNFLNMQWSKREELKKTKINRFEELKKEKLEYKHKKDQMNYDKEIMLLDPNIAFTLASH